MSRRMSLLSVSRCVLMAGLIGVVGVAAPLALTGCGGGGSSDSGTQQQEQVDPRYASAEALTSHINQVVESLSSGDLGQLRHLTAAFYAENPKQERVVGMFDHVHAVADLFDAASARFPNAFQMPEGTDAEFEPARIVTNDGQRATIRPEGDDDFSMQLVKVGERWHISGYTLEHGPDMAESFTDENLSKVEALMASVGREARSMLNRLQGGDFATEDAFMMALMGSAFSIMAEHPDVMDALPDFGGLGGPSGMDAPPGGFDPGSMPPGFPQ